MPLEGDDITVLLNQITGGNPEAERQFLPVLYQELHRLASSHLKNEREGHTLQPTALVNEAYLRLVGQREQWSSRTQFFALASQMMRRVLVDYARQRNRAKRGSGVPVEQFDEGCFLTAEKSSEILELDEALEKLAKLEPRQVRVVELRYFGGLTVDEVAALLQVSPKTVKRDWTVARAWLHRTLSSPTA
jgi:RNA polymerase sigma factor (TIGR02999 family)